MPALSPRRRPHKDVARQFGEVEGDSRAVQHDRGVAPSSKGQARLDERGWVEETCIADFQQRCRSCPMNISCWIGGMRGLVSLAGGDIWYSIYCRIARMIALAYGTIFSRIFPFFVDSEM